MGIALAAIIVILLFAVCAAQTRGVMRSALAIITAILVVALGGALAEGVWTATSTETETGRTVWCKYLTFRGIDRVERPANAPNHWPYCSWLRPG